MLTVSVDALPQSEPGPGCGPAAPGIGSIGPKSVFLQLGFQILWAKLKIRAVEDYILFAWVLGLQTIDGIELKQSLC